MNSKHENSKKAKNVYLFSKKSNLLHDSLYVIMRYCICSCDFFKN